jgi:two-component system, chemotaxis family, chemotaxis protein CheY
MSKKKVLVVDDSATVRQQVAAALTNVGFEVVEAADGQIGVDMINGDGSINVVICDVNMPRLNGIDMVLSVKSNQKHANLPILMLTTDGQPALIKKAKEAGARGWIVKPFNPAQLVAAVQKLAGVA